MAGGGGVLSSHRGSVQDFHHLVSRPDLNSSLQPADELRHCLLSPDADDDPLDELRIASRPAASVESSHKPRTLRPRLNNGFRSTPHLQPLGQAGVPSLAAFGPKRVGRR